MLIGILDRTLLIDKAVSNCRLHYHNDFPYIILAILYMSPENQYFDIKLKVAIVAYEIVRVMVNANSGLTPDYVLAQKTLGCPISMTKISSMESDTNFLNSSRGSKMLQNGRYRGCANYSSEEKNCGRLYHLRVYNVDKRNANCIFLPL